MWAVVAIAPLAACSSGNDAASDRPSGGFGEGGEPFPDAGSGDNGGNNGDGTGSDAGNSPSSPSSVRGRFLHGIPNLGSLQVCHDPDYVADDPSTDAFELDAGPLPAESLRLSISFGRGLTYSDLMPYTTGALTFHASVPEDAGALADDDPSACASPVDAVLPLPFHKALLGLDAGVADGGVSDGGARDGGARDAGSSDASTDALGELSLLPTLETTRPVTLLGSGVVLDEAGLAAQREKALQEYLNASPGDMKGATLAADRAVARIVAQRGPLFVIAEETAVVPEDGAVALHVVHLVADVPGADPRIAGVGELRVCVTEDTVERPVLPVLEASGLRFRTRTLLGLNFYAPPAYRFRFFASAQFDAEGKGCATTSLPPIAKYVVDEGAFKSGASYTLAVLGSASPAALCSPKEISLAKAGCAGRDPSEVAAHVLLLRDAKTSD
jgi:hypothetical protein